MKTLHQKTMDKSIYPVKKWNELQDQLYLEYCTKCKENNLEPRPLERYFCKFDYKTGYVLDGYCPIYKRRKKDLY